MGIRLERGRAVQQPAFPPVEERVVPFQPEMTTARRSGHCLRELCLLLIALAGCGDSYTDTTAHPQNAVVDDLGRPVHSRAQVERIVSLIPSVTEILLELGVAHRIVARTAYDPDARLRSLPSLGGARPGVEAVLQLRPDLVIVAPEDAPANLITRLEALGSTAYVADVRHTTDIYSTILRLGTILGVPRRADSLVSALRAGLDEVRRSHEDCPRPTVFYAIWHDPPQTASRGTFIDEVITAAGGRNIFSDLRSNWPLVSLEALVRRDPDYVVFARPSAAPIDFGRLTARPGWRDLTAIREGRTVVVDADLFHRPGPYVVEAAATLGRALHPARPCSGSA